MKKWLYVVILVVAMVITFVLGNFLTIKFGDRILVTAEEYNDLVATKERFKKIEKLESTLEKLYYFGVDEEQIYDGILHGMFTATGDQYTVYYNEEENKQQRERSAGSFVGIGVRLKTEGAYIVVETPIKGSPATKAGILRNDKIVAVDGVEVSADTYDEAFDLIAGEIDTDVNITVDRDGEILEFNITRDKVDVEAVASEMIDGLAYIYINRFDGDTHEEFEEHYEALLANNPKGLILDMRDNPGGNLDQCVDIADYILGKQVIVYTQNKAGEKVYYRSDIRKIKIPLVVLVNGNSASAAEILTGAIKDTEAGLVIGTTTFGKGIVQSVWELADGTGYKITTSEYFTPNGNNIHEIGIEPNIVVELDESVDISEVNPETDAQLAEAIRVLNENIIAE